MTPKRILALAAALFVGSGAYLAANRQANSPNKVVTESGFVAEQVSVGQSCVVIVHRGGDPNAPLAVVPCRH